MPRLPATAVPAPAAPTGRPSRIRLSWRRVTAGGPGRSRPATRRRAASRWRRSEEHTSELQSQSNLVCRLLLEQKNSAHTSPPPTTANTPRLVTPTCVSRTRSSACPTSRLLADATPPTPRASLDGTLEPHLPPP